ncbi:serine/threonine-protein kinase [Bradymonas sediminis]|uniref:non-specific serine/threonine protein kinase n=1 Tax=Bradymonas sediminis TaxID=1548548 RepID=A0A2Z4FN51_9DELT|nr:serine/threonine-protein kinase [Bradymonas sediminis]AWV90280.1 hypothetical protein DN745_13440 [Bradymonas sediminis]TDP75752.1 serine/threonine protein kinase [Bradymonas sediminis]
MGRTQRLNQPEEFGKYQLVARLAHGRMGDVYRAKSHGVEGFEKILVIKAINPGLAGVPGLVDTIIDEAKRSVALSHANIAQVYDLGQTDDGRFYLATEYISGFDLARALTVSRRSAQPLPQELAIFIASEVAKGLDYAHRRKDFDFNSLNILHRDLVPSNIVLSFDGEAKITDFGVSRALDLVGSIDAIDTRRRLLYVAPEVAQGQPHTRQSDIFSLGLVLYEMLAGRHPYEDPNAPKFDANTPQRTVEKFVRRVKEAKIEPISQHATVPRKLQQIVESMLVPDPAGRATSAGQVYEELIGYLFGNNLRADSRTLGQFVQQLRREEQRIAPEEIPQEVGFDEISMGEWTGSFSDEDLIDDFAEHLIGDGQPRRPQVPQLSSPTHADLPTAKIQELLAGRSKHTPADPSDSPELPGALQDYFLSVRAGNGKAVLATGQFGSGRDHLSDRLINVLGWRGNTQAIAIQATRDDLYRPFGVLTDLILRCLQDTVTGSVDLHRSALQMLRALPDVSPQAADTLGALWDIEAMPLMDYNQRRANLTSLFNALLRDFCRRGPMVLVIDRVELVDRLTLDVLRDLVATIDALPVMLVMTTHSEESTRAAFNLGNPENLETVKVLGKEDTRFETFDTLSDLAAEILLILVVCGQPMSQSDFAQILQIPSDTLMLALRELVDSGAVRVPEMGVFYASSADSNAWVHQNFAHRELIDVARTLARYYKHRVARNQIDRLTPTLIMLHALAGDRRRMLRLAGAYSRWLERAGWTGIAIEFYRHVADLLAEHSLGSPQARIDYMLLRAELALDLSLLDDARASLQPIAALSESLRNEHGTVRGQLLFGQMAMQQDDLEEAKTYFHRASSLARNLNDADLLARSLLALAGWNQRYGDLAKSHRNLESAQNLFSHSGTFRMDLRTRSKLLHQLVEMWTTRGVFGQAAQRSADLSRLAEVCELTSVQCRAMWAQAQLLDAKGQYTQALELLERAEAKARSGDLTALRIALIREKAATALHAGEYALAAEIAEPLIALAGEHQDLYSQQRARDLNATAHCLLGHHIDASLKHLSASLERAQTRQIPRDIYLSHVHLAHAFSALGREDLAQTHRDGVGKLAQKMRLPSAITDQIERITTNRIADHQLG